MLFMIQPNSQDSIYEVVSVDRKQTPAFRLGYEVNDTMVVRKDGKEFTIRLSSQHTLCGPVKLYAKGEKVAIKKSELHDGDLVSRSSVQLEK